MFAGFYPYVKREIIRMTRHAKAGTIPPMTITTQPFSLLERIQMRLTALGISENKACDIAKVDRNTIRDLRRGKRQSLTLPTLAKIAVALQTSVAWLSGEEDPPDSEISSGGSALSALLPPFNPSSLPLDVDVLGTAAGSAIGSFTIDGPVERVRRPPALMATKTVYALYVTGRSMEPRYRAGDLIFVSPDRPPRAGDDVIIQTRNHESAPVQAWIKTLHSETDDDVTVRQINPPSEVVFKRKYVIAIHRVLSTRELFGI